jgi:hypothetical protein
MPVEDLLPLQALLSSLENGLGSCSLSFGNHCLLTPELKTEETMRLTQIKFNLNHTKDLSW